VSTKAGQANTIVELFLAMISGIYVITDEQLIPGRTHAQIAKAALDGGAAVIQLRDKCASDEYLIEAGGEIRRLTSEAGALFIVNDRLEVALACDADGLHVGQSDRPAGELRSLLKGKLLGVSVLNSEQAAKARADGADHLGVGPIFATATKPDADPPTGLDMIQKTKAASGGLPIIAIGGINEGNLAEVRRAGADSAAVISAIVCAEDMVFATRRLADRWSEVISDQ
jgi:thiamine-phosphate diphosphorylase